MRLLHEAPRARVGQLLAADLNVPAAIDVAAEAGGDVARLLISVLGRA